MVHSRESFLINTRTLLWTLCVLCDPCCKFSERRILRYYRNVTLIDFHRKKAGKIIAGLSISSNLFMR